jgi:hypothetical protein
MKNMEKKTNGNGAALKGHKQFINKLEKTFNEGCWIIIHEDTGFSGKSLRLDGPIQFTNLKRLPGADQDWGDKIGSIETGPNARLTVYDDEDFKGDHIDNYGPNTRTDVSGDLDDNIDSLVISQA